LAPNRPFSSSPLKESEKIPRESQGQSRKQKKKKKKKKKGKQDRKNTESHLQGRIQTGEAKD
jgi:hypothetical protein